MLLMILSLIFSCFLSSVILLDSILLSKLLDDDFKIYIFRKKTDRTDH